MAPFDDVPASVTCALLSQDEFATYSSRAETPSVVRVCKHTGEPVVHGAVLEDITGLSG